MILEVDPETAMVEIKRYLVAHDCGVIINPLLVEGQIHGGVAHGIGNAFYEQLIYDDQGQLLNASFMDYLLPTATDVPPIETAHRETASPFNPMGLKGVGEAGCIPDWRVVRAGGGRCACRTSGVEITEIPLSPNRLFELIDAARREMILSGDFHVQRSRATVFELLQDPAVLAKALPGTKTLTKTGEDQYEGVMKVSVGPMTAAEFVVKVELKDKVAPERFTMHIDGKGGVGFTKGTATIELQEAAGPCHRDDLHVRRADWRKDRRRRAAAARVGRQDDDETGARLAEQRTAGATEPRSAGEGPRKRTRSAARSPAPMKPAPSSTSAAEPRRGAGAARRARAATRSRLPEGKASFPP